MGDNFDIFGGNIDHYSIYPRLHQSLICLEDIDILGEMLF